MSSSCDRPSTAAADDVIIMSLGCGCCAAAADVNIDDGAVSGGVDSDITVAAAASDDVNDGGVALS